LLVVVTSIVMATIEFTWSRDVEASLRMRSMGAIANRAQMISGMLAISIFFAGLGASSGDASDRDARRRLSFIWVGSSISLTPVFLIALYSLVIGWDMFLGVPQWIVFISLVLLPLFPLTLAYVIVVQRAMNLRVAIRLGLQYALARRGVRLLQIALISIVVTLIVNGVHENMRTVDQLPIIAVGLLALGLQRSLTRKVSE
jgi:phosphoserine phosphatase RsbU/P